MPKFVYRCDGSWKSVTNANRLRLVSISNQHRTLSLALQCGIFTSSLLSFTLNFLLFRSKILVQIHIIFLQNDINRLLTSLPPWRLIIHYDIFNNEANMIHLKFNIDYVTLLLKTFKNSPSHPEKSRSVSTSVMCHCSSDLILYQPFPPTLCSSHIALLTPWHVGNVPASRSLHFLFPLTRTLLSYLSRWILP